jgi:hypothetical protein
VRWAGQVSGLVGFSETQIRYYCASGRRRESLEMGANFRCLLGVGTCFLLRKWGMMELGN